MKKISLLIISILTIFLLNGCTSKAQTDVIDSNSKDISELLKTLIQKEKEINELNKKLELCKEQKTKK
jgi:outer membrane murein-binding lipoprotein Lpp